LTHPRVSKRTSCQHLSAPSPNISYDAKFVFPPRFRRRCPQFDITSVTTARARANDPTLWQMSNITTSTTSCCIIYTTAQHKLPCKPLCANSHPSTDIDYWTTQDAHSRCVSWGIAIRPTCTCTSRMTAQRSIRHHVSNTLLTWHCDKQ